MNSLYRAIETAVTLMRGKDSMIICYQLFFVNSIPDPSSLMTVSEASAAIVSDL